MTATATASLVHADADMLEFLVRDIISGDDDAAACLLSQDSCLPESARQSLLEWAMGIRDGISQHDHDAACEEATRILRVLTDNGLGDSFHIRILWGPGPGYLLSPDHRMTGGEWEAVWNGRYSVHCDDRTKAGKKCEFWCGDTDGMHWQAYPHVYH